MVKCSKCRKEKAHVARFDVEAEGDTQTAYANADYVCLKCIIKLVKKVVRTVGCNKSTD